MVGPLVPCWPLDVLKVKPTLSCDLWWPRSVFRAAAAAPNSSLARLPCSFTRPHALPWIRNTVQSQKPLLDLQYPAEWVRAEHLGTTGIRRPWPAGRPRRVESRVARPGHGGRVGLPRSFAILASCTPHQADPRDPCSLHPWPCLLSEHAMSILPESSFPPASGKVAMAYAT